jgi:hypothetical protein
VSVDEQADRFNNGLGGQICSRGVLGAGFRLWLFGLARPSPCGGPFGSTRGAIYLVKSPVQRVHKAEIQPGVGGDAGNRPRKVWPAFTAATAPTGWRCWLQSAAPRPVDGPVATY